MHTMEDILLIRRALLEKARTIFSNAVLELPGPKKLFLDPALYDARYDIPRYYELFTDQGLLQSLQIQAVRQLNLQPDLDIQDWHHHNDDITASAFIIRSGRVDVILAVIKAIKATQSLFDPLSVSSTSGTSVSIPPKNLIITVSRFSRTLDRLIAQHDLVHDVHTACMDLGFVPIDTDLISLEYPRAYWDYVAEANENCIVSSVAALAQFQQVTGWKFQEIKGAGSIAEKITKKLKQAAESNLVIEKTNTSFSSYTEISQVIFSQDDIDTDSTLTDQKKNKNAILLILDRGIDIPTTLLTQWTYEGLMDEIFGMSNNTFEIDVTKFANETASMIGTALHGADDTKKFGSQDLSEQKKDNFMRETWTEKNVLFQELRNLNFFNASRRLNSKASNVQSYYNNRPDKQQAELKEVADFVSNLKTYSMDHKSLSIHTALAAEISTKTFENSDFKRCYDFEKEILNHQLSYEKRRYILDMIAKQDNLSNVLRLLCLWSITNGIEEHEYDEIKTEILSCYGLENLYFLRSLEDTGLLSSKGNSNLIEGVLNMFNPSNKKNDDVYSWGKAIEYLKLVQPYLPDGSSVEENIERNVYAAYAGYMPLTVKLIELGIETKGWSTVPVSKKLLPDNQSFFYEDFAQEPFNIGKVKTTPIVLYFVGGVTRAELSGIRSVLHNIKTKRPVLVATTSLMSGNSFIESLRNPN